jgi:chemotaxis response regulator CheB/chemotaxis methyl-accepting protein methylase
MSSFKDESVESAKAVVEEVSRVVSEMAGIQLGQKQSSMVENRLRTRMVRLGIDTFQGYLSHLKQHAESESQALLSLLTTHHTYFFREFSHFEYLLNRSLNCLIERARIRPDKTINIWSAACSRGQEVYSLSMFFNFHLSQMAPDVKFKIWGTDIDPESVKHAVNGVYKVEELKQSPAMYLENNWIRGKGNVQDFTKAKDSLRQNCKFTTANLLSCEAFLKDKMFDVIFCRNVFIYFNQDQIKQVAQSFMKHLDKDGFLILGVSESLNSLGLNLDLTGPSVYQHKRGTGIAGTIPRESSRPTPARTIEVLSVDDSPTILALLKKVLTSENGFTVAATAKNGREALNILKSKKFDVITLDLHMPELDGLGFLQEFKDRGTPVLILSSINRDDTTIAQKAISLGAADYIEKPSLENLAQAGNEIRAKIKTVLQMRKASTKSIPTSIAPVSMPKMSGSSGKIKVLIVDDSQTIRNLLSQILSKDPAFEVVGLAEKPSQVEDLIKKHKPDVITLDIHMPEMDGVTLLQKIYPKYRIPTVMISSISKEEGPQVLKALEIGAIDYIQKPKMSELGAAAATICERLKIAAKANTSVMVSKRSQVRADHHVDNGSLIVMGASTGGTEALRVVLESLPAQIPPILIVQHIPPVFSAAFAQRLNELCQFEVREAKDGDEVKPNLVLIAPGGTQMGVRAVQGKLFIQVTDDAPMNRHKPSVDYLFKSVGEKRQSKIVAVILTGMGADGARQMKVLRDAGARTIAQDQQSSVVYGMPREAAAMGGAEFVLPLERVAEKLLTLCDVSEKNAVKKVS